MDDQSADFRRDFIRHWVMATLIGWIAGAVAAIILSYLVVNLVYHRQTNLIVGLCVGSAVALTQKIIAGPRLRLTNWWVWGATIGIGLPFAALVLLYDLGEPLGEIWSSVLIVAGSAICGLLQVRTLRPHTPIAYRWVLVSTLSWSLAWLLSAVAGAVGFLAGGAILGLLGGGGMIWLQIRLAESDPA